MIPKNTVKLRLIKDYPFDITLQRNQMHLTYTAFAGKPLLQKLQIQIQGYRDLKARHTGKKYTVLICHDFQLDQNTQQILYGTYHLISSFHPSTDEVQVLPLQTPFSLRNINGYILPNVKPAKQLLVSCASDIDSHFLSKFVSLNPFLIGKFQEIIIDLDRISEDLIHGDWNFQTLIRRKKNQNRNTEIHNYLKIRLAVSDQLNSDKDALTLFEPGVTKLTVFPLNQSQSSFSSVMSSPPIYNHIFMTEPYKDLQKSLSKFIKENCLIGLQCEKGTGMTSFLYNFAKINNMEFELIDCSELATPRQMYNRLKNLYTNQRNLLFLKNTEWLITISNNSATNSGSGSFDPYKNCLKKIQESFFQGTRKSMKNSVLIIEFEQAMNSEVFQKVQSLSFLMNKQQKTQFLQMVIRQNIDLSQQLQDDNLLLKTALGIGWTRFNQINTAYYHKFNDRHYVPLQKGETDQVSKKVELKDWKLYSQGLIEQIHKYTKVQKVQNIANVTWDDIGGLQTAKQEITQTILLPTKHPQIFDDKIPPRTGLLLYGPPGTGKTMLGKCIANECKMGFISVKGPQLLNMYIGESEKNLRRLFERAYKSRPCIVFMDELDALIPKRGNSGDSNQVMDRIVSELLMQMDIAGSNGIFIIGATNRPDLLDPSVLISGRFDKQIYLGITKDREDQRKILQAQTRHIKLDKNVNFDQILDSIPKNFTGADFYGLTSKAIMNSMERVVADYQLKITQYSQKGQIFLPTDITITVLNQDFLEAAKDIVPSVSQKQLQHYEQLRKKYT